MTRLTFKPVALSAVAAAGMGLLLGAHPVAAQTVMQQCGQQYQAAKAGNTLNGQSWNQYRVECAARLKAQAGSTAQPAATAATPAPAADNPLKPTPAAAPVTTAPAATPSSATSKSGKPMSPGRAAFVTRERQCGSEWKANKVSLTAQTPGLTWPKYLSQCNARLKAAGQ